MKNRNNIIDENIEDVIKVLDFHFHNTIKNIYKSEDSFRNSVKSFWKCGRADNKQLTRYIKLFPNIISKLVQIPRDENGKQYRITNEVIEGISGSYTVVGKVNRGKDGKSFTHGSFIMINENHIGEVLGDIRLELHNNELLSNHFTMRQKKLIRKIILTSKSEEIRTSGTEETEMKTTEKYEDKTDTRKTFDVTLDDGTQLRVQKSRIKNNSYLKDYNRMLEKDSIAGDRFKCEWSMKKIDFVRWITDGEFNKSRPCSIHTLMYYGDRKFKSMVEEGWKFDDVDRLDHIFNMTEGLWTEETYPECENENV